MARCCVAAAGGSITGVHLDELYRAVWDNPDDDATKLVLADALLAIGDPRGELIQLQFSDRHDESGAMRLLQRHGLTWLGALRGKVIPLAYEKGFLAACQIVSADGAGGHPEWSTVHTVEIFEDELPLLDDPALRSLKHVIGVEADAVRRLLVMRVASRLVSIAATDERVVVEHHTAFEALPRLASVGTPHLRIARGPDGKLSALSARWTRELGQLLAQLPPESIVSATIKDTPRSRRDELSAQLEQFPRMTATISPMYLHHDRDFEEEERIARQRRDDG